MNTGKKVLVIDGQGGGIGKTLVTAIKQTVPEATVTAVGTNSVATAAMRKAGADQSATGENAVLVACRTADVILGPVGIVIADALMGEISPAMAVAVAQSRGTRILIPCAHCDNIIAGTEERNTGELIRSAVKQLQRLCLQSHSFLA